MDIARIAAVDDQQAGRQTMRSWVETLFGDETETIEFDTPPANIESLVRWVQERGIGAVLIDHKLNARGYSNKSGLHLAAELTQAKIPAVLMTSYDRANIRDYIWYSRRVPAYVQKGHMSDLPEALDVAVKQVRGEETNETKPYTTIVRVDSVDEDEVGLVVPAYSTSELLLVRLVDIRKRVAVDLVEGLRFKALINLGARSKDELYLDEMVALDAPKGKYAAMLRP